MAKTKSIKFQDAYDAGRAQTKNSSAITEAYDNLKRIHTQVKQLEALETDRAYTKLGWPVPATVMPADMKEKLAKLIAMKQDIEDLHTWCNDYSEGRMSVAYKNT